MVSECPSRNPQGTFEFCSRIEGLRDPPVFLLTPLSQGLQNPSWEAMILGLAKMSAMAPGPYIVAKYSTDLLGEHPHGFMMDRPYPTLTVRARPKNPEAGLAVVLVLAHDGDLEARSSGRAENGLRPRVAVQETQQGTPFSSKPTGRKNETKNRKPFALKGRQTEDSRKTLPS